MRTDKGAAVYAGFSGCIGRDDFDPSPVPSEEQHARIFGAIVTSLMLSLGYLVNQSTSIDLITSAHAAWIVMVVPVVLALPTSPAVPGAMNLPAGVVT